MYQAETWIKQLELLPHPEGGFYKEVYRDSNFINQDALGNRFSGDRNISTAIYYLLRKGDFSCFHRIQSDELWHHYSGGTTIIYYLKNGELITQKLGLHPESGEMPMVVIPKNVWFAAELDANTSYALMGCTVAPGFDFTDFEKASRKDLYDYIEKYGTKISQLISSGQ